MLECLAFGFVQRGERRFEHAASRIEAYRRNERTSWTDYLVDSANRLRAIREGGDRLSPTNGVAFDDAGKMQRGHDEFVSNTTWYRHGYDDLANASHLGWNDRHQHCRGVRRLASRHVYTDSIQRRYALTQTISFCILEVPGMNPLFALMSVIRLDA